MKIFLFPVLALALAAQTLQPGAILLVHPDGSIKPLIAAPPSPPSVVRITNNPPNEILPLSVKMRMAAKVELSQSDLWHQRFSVVKVVEEAKTRDEEDGRFTTNYFLTVISISDETNSPSIWGRNKSKTMSFWTKRPTKAGDQIEMFFH